MVDKGTDGGLGIASKHRLDDPVVFRHVVPVGRRGKVHEGPIPVVPVEKLAAQVQEQG